MSRRRMSGAVHLARVGGLDFVMVWFEGARPAVHVDRGMRTAIVDVLSGEIFHSGIDRRSEASARRWVASRRGELLERWDAIGIQVLMGGSRRRARNSPQVSRFDDGMRVEIYFNDHARPHIHVRHSGNEIAVVDIRSAVVTEGKMSRTQKRKLLSWVREHEAELLEDWRRAGSAETILPIAPPE